MRIDYLHTEELANVDRVEVLKGPASILYGRVEPGSIINFVTKQPQNIPSFSAKQLFGSYNLNRTELDATGLVGALNSPLSYRVVAAHQTNGSWLDYYDQERIVIAPSLSLDISDRTRTTLQMEYSDFKNTGGGDPVSMAIPHINSRPPSVSRNTNLLEPWATRRNKYILLSLNTEHSFNDRWSLRQNLSIATTNVTLGPYSTAASNGDVGKIRYRDRPAHAPGRHRLFIQRSKNHNRLDRFSVLCE